MKSKLALTLFVTILVAFLLVSCAPPSSDSVQTNTSATVNSSVPSLEPVLYLIGKSGRVYYAVYEFKNDIGQHCTVVVDFHNSLVEDSNSAPSITCK